MVEPTLEREYPSGSGETAFAERVERAYLDTRLGIALVVPGLLIVWVLLWNQVEPWRLISWSAALLVLYTLRVAVSLAHARRRQASGESNPRGWAYALYASLATTGFAWSALYWLVGLSVAGPLHLSAAAVLLGVCAVALSGLATLPLGYAIFSGSMLLPVAATLMAMGEAATRAMGITLLAFLLAMNLLALRTCRMFVQRSRLQSAQAQALATLHAQLESQTRLKRQAKALATLTDSDWLFTESVDAVLRNIAEVCATVIEVERVSLWRFDAEKGAIVCADLFERGLNRHSNGTLFQVSDYPSYFAALASRQIVAAEDAHADLRTREFSQGYLGPLGIGAMLDAPLLRPSGLDAVLSCEHVGGPRAWTEDEKLFAASLVNLAALAIESAEHRQSVAALAASEARFRDFSQASADLFYEADAKGRISWLAESTQRILGIPGDAILGRRIQDIANVGQDSRDETAATYLAAWRTRATFRGLRFLMRGPSPIWLSVSGTPLFAADGAFQGYRGAAADVTNEVRSDIALRESERRLAALMAHLPGEAYRCRNDAAWTLEFASQGVYDLTGYRPEELTSQRTSFGDLIHPEDRERVWSDTQRALEQRQPFVLEYRLRSAGGAEKWLLERGAAVYAEDGAVQAIEGFIIDISERKQAELALVQSEARFRDFSQASADMFWEADAKGRISWVSESTPRILGVSPDMLRGLRIQDIADVEQDADGKTSTAYLTAWRERAPFRGLRFQFAVSARRWLSVSATPVFDSAGSFTGYRGTATDVTREVAAEAALRRLNDTLEARVLERTASLAASEARLRAVTDALPMPIFCKDRDGRFLLSNRATAALYGKTSDEMIGATVRQAGMDERAAVQLDEADRRMRASGQVQLIPNWRLLDPAGRERVFINMRIPFRHSDEHPDAVLGVAIEITELEAAKLQVEQLNRDLEGRVKARTAELAAKNRELESFSYSISHDLRSPLRAITGFSAILVAEHAGSLHEDARQLAERIAAAGLRMASMIDGLLELSRLSNAPLRRQPVDLTALAQEVWNEVAAADPARQVAFSAPVRCLADCDPVLVRNVLQNLLGNAFKYSRRQAQARVEFGQTADGEAGAGERAFYVRDNGAGFDMVHAGMLFGAFQRLHRASEFEGTGIGLATVRRIVERHGGRIWAEASPDAGAVFRFTLAA